MEDTAIDVFDFWSLEDLMAHWLNDSYTSGTFSSFIHISIISLIVLWSVWSSKGFDFLMEIFNLFRNSFCIRIDRMFQFVFDYSIQIMWMWLYFVPLLNYLQVYCTTFELFCNTFVLSVPLFGFETILIKETKRYQNNYFLLKLKEQAYPFRNETKPT